MKPTSRAQLGKTWLFAGAMICLGGCGHATKVGDVPGENRKEDDRKADDDDKSPRAKDDRRPRYEARPSGPASRGEGKQNEVPIAPSPTQSLAEGSVKDVQKKLQDKGMLASGQNNVTGKWDSKTENALRKFQAENGLPATGFPDRASAKALGLDPEELFKRQDKPNTPEEKREEAQEEKREEKRNEEKREDLRKEEEREEKQEDRQEDKQEKKEAKKQQKASKAAAKDKRDGKAR